MEPYEYFVMKFANRWISKEQDLHQELGRKDISLDSVVKALQYFQVARNFDGLKNDKKREFIADRLHEYSKHITKNNFHEKVQELADQFKIEFGSSNLSAATKLLWLRKRSPVLIFDSLAKLALEKAEDRKIRNYAEYVEIWQKHYATHQVQIKAVATDFAKVRQYSALWDKSITECKDIVLSDWFLERVFDMYLLYKGKRYRG